MKKKLLFISLLFSSVAGAQSLTAANEPAIGESSTMYLVDSFAVNYDAVTGTGVTWDYSNLFGYTGETRTVEVVDATTTPDAASFPTSTKAYNLGGTIMTYFDTPGTDRMSQGFKFTEPTIGDVVAKFDVDELTMVEYDFSLGEMISDAYSGDVTFNVGFPTTESLTGNAYAWVDGVGTMLFPGAVSVPNVLRYKSIDTSYSTAPIVGAIEIIRTQYEYYDHASQNLPIFIHATIAAQYPGGAPLSDPIPLVLSKYQATTFAGLDENAKNRFSIYPNPANESITLKGEFDASAKGSILDQSGRVVATFSPTIETVNISDLESGMYIVSVEENGKNYTKQFIKK